MPVDDLSTSKPWHNRSTKLCRSIHHTQCTGLRPTHRITSPCNDILDFTQTEHIRNKLYLFEVLSRVREVREKTLTLAKIGNGSVNAREL
ncbi:hypothetical protein YC2023_104588 [Brassica napus]